jgi:hypothetical protein
MSCETCELCIEQPPFWEAVTDGVFIKQMLLKDVGTRVPQHAHVYDHTSMLATGAVRVWMDEKLIGDFRAPYPLFIKAKIKHTFQSLEPNTLIYCIHRLHPGYQIVPIHEEHQLS